MVQRLIKFEPIQDQRIDRILTGPFTRDFHFQILPSRLPKQYEHDGSVQRTCLVCFGENSHGMHVALSFFSFDSIISS